VLVAMQMVIIRRITSGDITVSESIGHLRTLRANTGNHQSGATVDVQVKMAVITF